MKIIETDKLVLLIIMLSGDTRSRTAPDRRFLKIKE